MTSAEQTLRKRIADAESPDGVVTIVVADAGETTAMTSDRAWEMALGMASGEFEHPEACAAASRALVWRNHLG
jgi:hypothetical protein